MKRIIIAFTAISFLFLLAISCVKGDDGCTQKTVQSEEGTILGYASANGITAARHSSGMYYQIIDAGNPAIVPTLSSTVTAKYTGKFMDGNIFDSSPAAGTPFPLSGVITGWQLGLPLIGKGGKIKLIIPSSLAYGCTGRSSIPPYAVLFFEVEIINVQ